MTRWRLQLVLLALLAALPLLPVAAPAACCLASARACLGPAAPASCAAASLRCCAPQPVSPAVVCDTQPDAAPPLSLSAAVALPASVFRHAASLQPAAVFAGSRGLRSLLCVFLI